MSAKIKLLSCISLFILMLGVLILGVLAAGTQTITLDGNINFNVADKSLWVKSASISNDNYTEEPLTDFMPGYINSNFNLNISDQINTYGAFTLHFEIINTTTSAYDVTATYSGAVSGVTVTANPTQIPASSAEVTEITSSTPTTQLDIMVTNPNGANIDLSDITITFEEEWVPTPASSFEFSFDDKDHTASITKFIGSETDVIIPSIVNQNGIDYTVTSIADAILFAGAFYLSGIESIVLPDTMTTIGDNAFASCSSLTSITIPKSVTTIGSSVFKYCTSLTSVTFENTTGWELFDSSTSIEGTPVTVTDPEQNATWLTITIGYYDKYWKRS